MVGGSVVQARQDQRLRHREKPQADLQQRMNCGHRQECLPDLGHGWYIGGLAVLPPIAVQDELEAGLLIEADRLPGIIEAFYAVTLERRFPNPMLRALIMAGQ